MKKTVLILAGIFLSLYIIGCGGSKDLPKTEHAFDDPEVEAIMNYAKDPNYFLASATATSRDMQMAIDKAAMDARIDIGRQMEVKVSALQKRFMEETGQAANSTFLEQFSQASKTVVSQTLNGSTIAKRKVLRDGDNWRAYILVEMAQGAMNKALMNQLQKDNELYTRFRATQGYEEMEKQIKDYEASKNK
jgi:hypothetical protein